MVSENGQKLYRREGKRFVEVQESQFRKYADRFQVERQTQIDTRVFDTVFDIQRTIMSTASKILLESDEAIKQDRVYQRMMRHDPDVMSPLLQRQMAVAQLDWQITAEDEDDAEQVAQAEILSEGITRFFRRWHMFIRQLEEAVWYGPSAANISYKLVPWRDREYFMPVGWQPIHPDSLAYKDDGSLGMYVNIQFTGDQVQGRFGPVHLFTETERKAIVHHTFMAQAPDYQEPRDGRYFWGGRGLRDTVYFFWHLKQIALQAWSTWIQRYGVGTLIGKYPEGNTEARKEMESIITNMVDDNSALIPTRGGSDVPQYDLQLQEANARNTQVFADLIKGYLAGQIKELLVGQTATTEATNTGLGSDVATRHAETFWRIIRWDAESLRDSIQYEMVGVMNEMNFGPTSHMPQFSFVLEDIDSEKWIDGVQKAYDMGAKIPERQMINRLGIDEAKEGEEVLERGEEPIDVGSGGGLGFRSNLFSKGRLDGWN